MSIAMRVASEVGVNCNPYPSVCWESANQARKPKLGCLSLDPIPRIEHCARSAEKDVGSSTNHSDRRPSPVSNSKPDRGPGVAENDGAYWARGSLDPQA